MKKLTALLEVPTYLERYISIRDKKNWVTRAPLIEAHELVEARYNAYSQAINLGNLAGLLSNPQALELRAPLRACYDGVTQPLRQLKREILDAQPRRLLKYCPMCGVTLPGTFDHYMPAVRFPEYAVHPLNLVPCCAKCNSTKDDDWLSADGRRQFLHAYTDLIPDLQFVKVTLHQENMLDGVGATFFLDRPEGIVDEFWSLIDSHFRRLKLIDLYNERGSDEVSEILADCRAFSDEGGTDVRAVLNRWAVDRGNIYGRNHWVAVLMSAMANHPNLLAWVTAV